MRTMKDSTVCSWDIQRATAQQIIIFLNDLTIISKGIKWVMSDVGVNQRRSWDFNPVSFQVTGKIVALFTVMNKWVSGDDLSENKSFLFYTYWIWGTGTTP